MKQFSKLVELTVVILFALSLVGCVVNIGADPNHRNISDPTTMQNFAWDNSKTCKLIKDITVYGTLEIPEDSEKTIDLNGKTLVIKSDSHYGGFYVKGILHIKDTSWEKSGVVKVEGIPYEEQIGKFVTPKAPYIINVADSGVLSITGGNFLSSGGCGISVSSTGKITKLTGCCIGDGLENAPQIGLTVYGSVVSMDCDIYARVMAIVNNGTIDTISGGTYSASNADDSGEYDRNDVYALYNKGTIKKMYDCYFSATQFNSNYCSYGLYNDSNGKILNSAANFYAYPRDGNFKKRYNYYSPYSTFNKTGGTSEPSETSYMDKL